MAVSLASDFKIVDAVMQTRYTEVASQAADNLMAATDGAIQILTPENKGGFFERDAFFKLLTDSGITRRDITSTSAVTPLKLEQDEIVRVKLDRKFGPTDVSLDSLRKIASDVEAASMYMGEQAAKGVTVDALNTGLGALVQAALNVGATAVYDGTAGTITHAKLVSGMALLGDRAPDIKCWVMHSKVYHDLIGVSISDKITNVADVALFKGSAPTFGKPVLVTDSADLILDTTTDQYYTLGLTAGAISVKVTEQMSLINTLVAGYENLIQRFQGEYAYHLGLKGYAWATATSSPTQAQVKTGSNWTKKSTSLKDTAGIVVKTV